MSTPPITLEWIRSDASKLGAYNISAEALAMINKSETLKADIRAYAASDLVAAGVVDSTPGSASIQLMTAGSPDYLSIASDRFQDAESTFNVLAHELGHFRVEVPDAAIANARANAWASGDRVAYENACNLTEGYARYNEVRARNEVLASNRAQADAEGRSLSMREQLLEDRWSGAGPFATSPEGKDHNIVKGIEDAAGAYGQLLTPQEIAEAAAFALGENNKSNITSTTGQSYLEFCRNSANEIKASGPTPPAALGQERLETNYNADGSVAGSSVVSTTNNGDEVIAEFDAGGRMIQWIETDGAQNDADYSRRVTVYDSQGRLDSIDVLGDDGSAMTTDFDQANERDDRIYQQRVDAAGRMDWSNVTEDDGGVVWTDFDQANERGDRIYQQRVDAEGRLDWTNVTDDAGGVSWSDYDQANERGDRIYQQRVDAEGRLDWTNVTDDAGGVSWSDYDQANERGDRIYQQRVDAEGRLDWTSVTDDGGGVSWTDFDQTGVRGDAIWSNYTDAQGREDWRSVTQDSGRIDQIDFDQDNTQSWSRIERHFDQQGREDASTTFNDNGLV